MQNLRQLNDICTTPQPNPLEIMYHLVCDHKINPQVKKVCLPYVEVVKYASNKFNMTRRLNYITIIIINKRFQLAF